MGDYIDRIVRNNIARKKAYDKLLGSGMFFELHPNLTGDYKKDYEYWCKIYRQMQTLDNEDSTF